MKSIIIMTFTVGLLLFFQNCAPFSSESDNSNAPASPAQTKLWVNRSVGGGFPHKADFLYPPNRNSQTRAIVVLHGGGGTKHNTAFAFGIKKMDTETYSTDPNAADGYKEQFLIDNNVALIFVQGAHLPDRPDTFTWSNNIMTSGQDDKAMLIHLANLLRTQEGFSKVYLMGHSMGGSMTNRMLCEASATFDGYGSSAGPISSLNSQTCNPNPYRPYMFAVGTNDRIIQIVEDRAVGPDVNHINDQFLTLDSLTRTIGGNAFISAIPEFRNDITYYQTRVTQKCGTTMSTPVLNPNNSNWITKTQVDCGGTLALVQLRDLDHCQGAEGVGSYKCDRPLTSAGQSDYIQLFVDFFNAN